MIDIDNMFRTNHGVREAPLKVCVKYLSFDFLCEMSKYNVNISSNLLKEMLL